MKKSSHQQITPLKDRVLGIVSEILRNANARFIFIILSLLALGIFLPLVVSTEVRLTSSSVSIFNIAMNSGGSGVVVSSSDAQSVILTNAHICKVIQNGGIVQFENRETHNIVSFKKRK